MEAEKNIFGQYKEYVPVVLSEDQKVIVLAMLNAIANQITAALTPAEFRKEVANKQPMLQFLVGRINSNLPPGIDRVDGISLSPLVDQVVAERLAVLE